MMMMMSRSAGASETPVSSVPSPPAATSDHVRSNGALSTRYLF